MIGTKYDPEADVPHVTFGPFGSKQVGSTQVAQGVFVEFDADGTPIGAEIVSARMPAKPDRSLS